MINENITTDTVNNSSMSLLGDYLKQKRLDKNYSLEKLSQKTKISVNILKSLENNDYKTLPSAAYIKGFVKSYVKVLGLPMNEAINKMEYTYLSILGKPFPALNHTKQMTTSPASPEGKKRHDEHEPTANDIIESGDSIIENTKSLLPIIILVVVVVAFIGGYKLISSVVESEVNSRKPKDLGPTFESSSALTNQPAKVEAPVAKVEVKTEVIATSPEVTPPATTAKPAVEAVPVEIKAPEAVKAEAEVVRNFPILKFSKIRNPLFTVRTDAAENNDQTILAESVKKSVNSDLQNVYIKAIDGNTWLSYKVDNKPIVSQIISKGNDLFIQGLEIRIFLGNVNVTKIFYNNHLIETPTRSGVKSLIFPETSNEKFLLPLFPKANDDIQYTAEDYQKRMKIENDELSKKDAAAVKTNN